MAISRMQQPRQMQRGLGALDAPRQNYGFGSFVKKAVRGVKKIAKSPIGKAAIAGAIGFGIPGTSFGGLLGRGSFGGAASGIFGNQGGVGALFNAGKQNLMSRFAPKATSFLKPNIGQVSGGNKASFLSKLNPFGKNFDGKTAFLTGSAAALAAPFVAGMGGPEEVEEEVGEVMDPAAVTQRAKDFYSGMGTKGIGLDFMPKKKYIDENFYAQQSAADGGRIGYAMGGPLDDEEDEMAFARTGAGQSRRQQPAFLNMGGGAGDAQAQQMLQAEYIKYKNQGGDLSFEQFVQAVMQQQDQSQGMEQPMAMAAYGGRIGYGNGGDPLTEFEIDRLGQMGYDVAGKGMEVFGGLKVLRDILNVNSFANGGPVPDSTVPGYTTPAGYNKFDYRSGGVRVNAAEGGIMATDEASEMIDMGGNEKDYRDEGGFVAMGGEERADDVPARLSKNEFVFTADAVRNAGGGDIDAGSEVMQNLMDNLEQGGQVSEESQGMGGEEEMMSEEIIEEPNGAQAMYEQQQALQSRMA